IVVALIGFLYALLVKGMLALIAPPLCALWLLTCDVDSRWRLAPWIGIALMLIVTPIVAVLYERVYVTVTGESFFTYYLGLRLSREGNGGSGWPFPLNKVWNAGWYAAHVAWYGAPWSVLLAAGVMRWTAWRRADRDAHGWLRFALLATCAVVT